MRQWGGTLIFFAVLSAVLPYIGVQLILMAWVDLWGPTIGWIIRSAFVVVGIALLVLGKDPHAPVAEQAPKQST
ncbi:MAG: hypothetical protein ACOYN0_09820 [Phycisphaerales bacterium]